MKADRQFRADRLAGQEEIYVKPVPRLLACSRVLAGLTALGLLFGLIGFQAIPIQLTPTVDRPQITVTTTWPASTIVLFSSRKGSTNGFSSMPFDENPLSITFIPMTQR